MSQLTNLRPLAEQIIIGLLESDSLMEDRLDDVLKKNGDKIPGSTPQAKRQTLEHWMEYDPSRNKKYTLWIIKQYLTGKAKWTGQELDHVRDALNDFEHFLTMPAFNQPRDIYQYDYKKLIATTSANRGLMSKADRERGRKNVAAVTLSQVGDMQLLGFKDGNSLAEEAWRAYDEKNPNWDGDPHYKADPEYNRDLEPYSVDHLWCIRNPQRGADYIKNSPSKTFYVVEKGGWPFIGAVLSDNGSQIVDLHNHGVGADKAEQIYDLFKPVLDQYAQHRWSIGSAATRLFGTMRIIRGEIQPGETIQGVDLANSSITALPDDLTVSGNLSLANTKITRLPKNLKVQGDLDISKTAISELPQGLEVAGALNLSGTRISSLPQGLVVGKLDISNTQISQLPSNMEVKSKLNIAGTSITVLPNDLKIDKGATVDYSAPLTIQEIKRYFFWLREPETRTTFWNLPKNKGMSEEQKTAAWQEFVPKLLNHFQKDATVDKAVASVFKQVHPRR